MELRGLELEFIEDFYKRTQDRTLKCAKDYILKTVDELQVVREFVLLDNILKKIVVADFDITILVSILTITSKNKMNLPSRQDFHKRVDDLLKSSNSEIILID